MQDHSSKFGSPGIGLESKLRGVPGGKGTLRLPAKTAFMKKHDLIDNARERRYEFHIDGQIALIEYMKDGKGDVLLTHTEVPVDLEGQGIGSELTEAVLQDIDNQDLKVVPLCPFVAAYIKKHPEWRHLIA